jgi:type I restriction enzyme, S subunit
MQTDWRTSTVRELQDSGVILVEDGNHGEYRPRPNEFVDDGVKFIRAADMADGRVLFDSAQSINNDAKIRITKGRGLPGDVLLSHKGTVGKVALVEDDAPEFVCSPQTTFWRSLRTDVLDRRYLFAFLGSRAFQSQLYGRQNESDMAGYVSLTAQRGLSLVLPPIDFQRRISDVLGPLDEKIRLNRQMNQTLEEIAQALFKSWFVDFDAVKAKSAEIAAGKSPAEVERAAMVAISGKAEAQLRKLSKAQRDSISETAALFPAGFADSDLGPIPAGWVQSTLGNEVEFQTGPAFKSKEFSLEGTKLARGDNVKEGYFHWGEKTRYWPQVDHGLEKYLLEPGDVLIGMDGSKVGKNWVRVVSSDLPCLLVQRVARLRTKRSICESFIWLVISSKRFKGYVELVKTGSSIPHISGGQIKALPLALPPPSEDGILKQFEKLIGPLSSQMDQNIQQSRTLAQLRDTILPKLLSGEVFRPAGTE